MAPKLTHGGLRNVRCHSNATAAERKVLEACAKTTPAAATSATRQSPSPLLATSCRITTDKRAYTRPSRAVPGSIDRKAQAVT